MSQLPSPQSSAQGKHRLRDALGMALGIVGGLFFTLTVHDLTVNLFWRQIAPLMPWGNYGFWSLVWAFCVFLLIVNAIRFAFAMVVAFIMNALSLLVVRLTLPKQGRER